MSWARNFPLETVANRDKFACCLRNHSQGDSDDFILPLCSRALPRSHFPDWLQPPLRPIHQIVTNSPSSYRAAARNGSNTPAKLRGSYSTRLHPRGHGWHPPDFWAPPSFASFERMSADVERRMDALFRDQQSLLSGVSLLDHTSLANIPPGTISTTWVSTTTGSGFCTRETRITRTSAEAKPEIVSRQSGDCGTKSATGPSPGKSPDHDDGIIETSLKSTASDARPGTF